MSSDPDRNEHESGTMIKTKILTALLALLLWGSISAQTPTDFVSKPESQTVAQHSGQQDATSWKKAIQLDQGKTWKVNSATRVGIEKMLAAVSKVSSEKQSLDAKSLQVDLQAILQSIFQNCDMTGPTHDNLHIYLVPLIEKVDRLGDPGSPQAAKGLVAQIKAQLSDFRDYFQ